MENGQKYILFWVASFLSISSILSIVSATMLSDSRGRLTCTHRDSMKAQEESVSLGKSF